MPEVADPSPSRPAVALGLTFVIVGFTFAIPFALVPASTGGLWSGHLSAEVSNVYACVAWAGRAHFLYAFRGRRKSLAHARDDLGNKRLAVYATCVFCALALLIGLRSVLGAGLFGALVWVYFIDHFLKAEAAFEGKRSVAPSFGARWLRSYQPVVAFAWLSVVLLNVAAVDSRPWILLGVSLVLAGAVLGFGGWRDLAAGNVRGPLLALFFIGEGLVWGTFSRYGGPVFLAGVYVFHIAAGSYFHYLGSYFMGYSRAGSKDAFLHPLSILAVNLAVVSLGFEVAHRARLGWLTPILGVQWFALWVGLHLVSSDLFPLVKRGRPRASGAASEARDR